MWPIEHAVLVLLLATAALPQQVGVVELTEPEAAQAAAQQKGDLIPPGCAQETLGIIADGGIVPGDRQPQKISLEIVKLSSDAFEVDGGGRAEVRLKNVGESPIQIPWSRDSSLMRKAPNPDHLEWEEGYLSLVLRDKQNHTITLKGADRSLFGSHFVAGSELTIKPGEWITASLSFKVEDLYHIVSSAEFPVGEVKLFSEWGQALRKWDRDNCAWNRALYDFYGYYSQEHPTTEVQIRRSGSGDIKKTD